MARDEPFPVEFNELLAAEYNYIAQTALQANEDRARFSVFYLIAVGSLVAAIFGALSYYHAIEVALISELMLGAAVYFLQRVVLLPVLEGSRSFLFSFSSTGRR